MTPTIPADRRAKGMYWSRAWSLVEGCTHCSPGCDRCWSAAATHMRRRNPNPTISERMSGLTDTEGRFNGEVRLRYGNLDLPFRTRTPTVFAIWNDLFHESVSQDFQREAFEAMLGTQDRHIFLILTKRPLHMAARVMNNPHGPYRAGHIWFGTTVCNQTEADRNLPHLCTIPGNLWVSYEPALGAVNFTPWMNVEAPERASVRWIVCGGETGRTARLMSLQWGRDVAAQCDRHNVPLWFKQWGSARDTLLRNANEQPYAMPRQLPW